MSLAVISKSEKSDKLDKSDLNVSDVSAHLKSGHQYIVNKVYVYANKLVIHWFLSIFNRIFNFN